MAAEGISRYVIQHLPEREHFQYQISEILESVNVVLTCKHTREEAEQVVRNHITKDPDRYFDAKGNRLDFESTDSINPS